MVRRPFSPHPTRSGLSIVEVLVILTILTVTTGFLADTLISVARLRPMQRESELALEAARGVVEELRSGTFGLVYARYDEDPANDPDGPGTAPGAAFAVAGLETRPGDPDGLVGRIVLPVTGGELREDFADSKLGMPRDLNGDGGIDAVDHRFDYRVLPGRLVLEWRSKGRDRQLELHFALADL